MPCHRRSPIASSPAAAYAWGKADLGIENGRPVVIKGSNLARNRHKFNEPYERTGFMTPIWRALGYEVGPDFADNL